MVNDAALLAAPQPTKRLPAGTRVRMLDGSGIAYVTPDVRIGRPFDGTYRARQYNATTGGDRIEHGFIEGVHFVVEPVGDAKQRQLIPVVCPTGPSSADPISAASLMAEVA